jgi:hypothetical protein
VEEAAGSNPAGRAATDFVRLTWNRGSPHR